MGMRMMRPFMMWLVRKLPACDMAVQLASETLDRELTLKERFDLRLHLMICGLCSRYRDQIHFLHQLAPQLSERLQDEGVSSNGRLSDEARERMKRLLSARSQ